jgi:hypothetical protein
MGLLCLFYEFQNKTLTTYLKEVVIKMLVNLDDYITDSKYFKWKEALYLNTLKIYHSANAQEIENIKQTCLKLDKFRKFVDKPFVISCWIRPTHVIDEQGVHTGVNYNVLPNIKGAKQSAHIIGLAVDFDVVGLNQDQAMKLIKPKLAEYQMSAENNTIANGRTWIHLQNKCMSDGKWRVFNL